jgi:phage tail-like protein
VSEPAISYRFKVEVEGRDLGVFTKVEGLGAKYDVLSVKEGGENSFVHKLPGRIEYDNLKLTRPIDESSGELARWFTGYLDAVRKDQRLQLSTASISAYDGTDTVITTWELRGIFPVRYSGPSFDAATSKVLTETLELSHQGFWG